MAEPTWDELRQAVAFGVHEPTLPNGWTAKPKAIAGLTVLLGVFDGNSRHRCNVSLQDRQPADLDDRRPIEVDGFAAWWRRDFEDVPGANPVTNVIAQGPGFWACAAGYEEPTALAAILAAVART